MCTGCFNEKFNSSEIKSHNSPASRKIGSDLLTGILYHPLFTLALIKAFSKFSLSAFCPSLNASFTQLPNVSASKLTSRLV